MYTVLIINVRDHRNDRGVPFFGAAGAASAASSSAELAPFFFCAPVAGVATFELARAGDLDGRLATAGDLDGRLATATRRNRCQSTRRATNTTSGSGGLHGASAGFGP